MNYKLVMRLLVIIPLLMQGAPEDSSPAPSSTNRVPGGVLPWIIGAAVTGSCYWAYSHFNTNNKEEFSPEEGARQTVIAFKKCLQNNIDGSKNKYGIPIQCTEAAFDHFLMREYSDESSIPTVQEMLNAIQKSNS